MARDPAPCAQQRTLAVGLVAAALLLTGCGNPEPEPGEIEVAVRRQLQDRASLEAFPMVQALPVTKVDCMPTDYGYRCRYLLGVAPRTGAFVRGRERWWLVEQ